jgi:hypothetical protein
MAFQRTRCPDNPRTMAAGRFCLASLSKDLRGKAAKPDPRRHSCGEPKCETLVSAQVVELELVSHGDCDDDLARLLDGGLKLSLIHAMKDGDTRARGFHYARFEWSAPGTLIVGEMSGATNAGVHREPAFKACEKCESIPIDEGRFCGQVERARRKAFEGAQVFGIYRLDLDDPTQDGFAGAVKGTLEGVVLQPCRG